MQFKSHIEKLEKLDKLLIQKLDDLYSKKLKMDLCFLKQDISLSEILALNNEFQKLQLKYKELQIENLNLQIENLNLKFKLIQNKK
jgi:hypothetical protein